MLIVPKASVRVNLTIAILLTVVLSWIISGGVANYYNYLSFRSLRQEMMIHQDFHARPIPEPRFGLVEFFTGRPPFHHLEPKPQRTSNVMRQPGQPPEGAPGDVPPRPSEWFEIRYMLLRLVVALGLAVLSGVWLGRMFTKPLTQLAKGAAAFQAGDFDHQIPSSGKNEFAAVANTMNEMARQVSDQIHRLESDAQRRKQFLADVAHELRSPVTTMETMAGAMKDGLASDPKRRDFAISALVTTSHRMRMLVQDLMELAKLDLTEFPLNLVHVDLRGLISSAIQSHEVEASAAGITLNYQIPADSVKTVADPDRIAQVLDNIIGNAISYAGEGAGVNVSLENANPIRITIADTGKGIRAEDMPYVLDPFYRADSARTPNDSHSGLGLSIAFRLVEAHGGKLTISSEENRGTTVVITIPKKH